MLTVAFDYGSRPSWSPPSWPARSPPYDASATIAPPVPARPAPCRCAGTHVRRAAHLELPAVADRRHHGVLHRRGLAGLRRGPSSTLPWRSPAERRAQPGHLGPRPRRGPARPAADGRGGRRRDRRRAAPRRRGRHRHRQDDGLPRPGRAGRQARRGRHRHQGAAGSAGQQGPALPRRAPRRAVRLGDPQGPQQLHLPATRARGAAVGDHGQLELEELAATTKVEIKRLAEWSGTTRTGDQAELDWIPTDTRWQAVSVGSDECPGATAARWASRASPRRPASGPRSPTWSWSTLTSTGSTWPAAACCCPSTTWS